MIETCSQSFVCCQLSYQVLCSSNSYRHGKACSLWSCISTGFSTTTPGSQSAPVSQGRLEKKGVLVIIALLCKVVLLLWGVQEVTGLLRTQVGSDYSGADCTRKFFIENRYLGVILTRVGGCHPFCQAKVAPFIWRLQDVSQHLRMGRGMEYTKNQSLTYFQCTSAITTIQMFKQLSHFGSPICYLEP